MKHTIYFIILKGEFVLDCRDGAYCNNLDVNAANTGIVNITCIGSSTDYGCINGEIVATNAGSLYVYASYDGISGTDIYGQNISTTFEMTAIGVSSSFAGITGYSQIVIPDSDSDLSKFTLNYYGYGFYNVYIYKANDYSNIDYANINFNGCLQCEGKPGFVFNLNLYFSFV